MKHADTQSPVSFFANVARLPHKGLPVVIEADAAQRAALAEEHGLLSVEAYRAELLVVSVEAQRREGQRPCRGRHHPGLHRHARTVEAHIDEPVEALFLPEDSKLGRQGFEGGGEILLDAEGPDSPETFSGDIIDVGALAEQFFGLAIDPYPRKPGASLEAGGETDAG